MKINLKIEEILVLYKINRISLEETKLLLKNKFNDTKSTK